MSDAAPARVGWIGTGVMGAAMCGHLLDAGCPVRVFSRTRAKAQDLLARGARWADSAADVAASSDVTFSIVGFPADVREVVLGRDGVLAGPSDFAPGFYVEHFLKDMDIALREGKRMGLALPGLQLAERLYREIAALGHGRSGAQALILALERLAQSGSSDL